jgi:Spy/CpxP family protein refolding chaperone
MEAKKLSLLIIATLLFSLTAMSQETDKREDLPQRKEMIIKRRAIANVDREPFFTAEQKEAIKEIRLDIAKQLKPLRNELNELNARQKTLSTATDADLDAIYANIEKIYKIKTEIAKLNAKQHQEIRSLLTEKQLLQFDSHRNIIKRKINRRIILDPGKLPERPIRPFPHGRI